MRMRSVTGTTADATDALTPTRLGALMPIVRHERAQTPSGEPPPELDVDLVAEHAGQRLGERLDDGPVAGEGQAVTALGAPPRHRLALLVPVVAGPTADGGDIATTAFVAGRPVDLDRQLPAHRRLPLRRRLLAGERLEVQRATGAACEAGSVEEDAGAVDDSRRRAGVVGEDAT